MIDLDSLSQTVFLYRRLANGLSDMIEGGRLRTEHIPDDYEWLVRQLSQIASEDPS